MSEMLAPELHPRPRRRRGLSQGVPASPLARILQRFRQRNALQRTLASRRAQGLPHWSGKLTDDDVRLMRRLKREGMAYKPIARKFEVSASTAWHAITGRTFAHITDEPPVRDLSGRSEPR